MRLLSQRHETLSHEDHLISELRALSKSSADREAEEYDSITAELADAKSHLVSVKQTLAANSRAATAANQSLRDTEHGLELRRAAVERLRNEKAKLEQAQRECLQTIRSIERHIGKLNGTESHAEELEKITETRAAHLRALEARVSELRSSCHSKADAISQTVAEIERIEEGIDSAIEQGFVIISGSSSGDEDDATLRELLRERDELLSEPAEAVAEALAVIQMPLEDAGEVRGRIKSRLPQTI
jgi:chromosome segregation ATPase